MKKLTLFLLLTMVTVLSAEAHKHRNSEMTISIQTFYDQLSPYGEWIISPDYGYVWRPYFDTPEDFRPYSSAGNWVYTTYGWTWVSDYDWGWATFHYGRWYLDDYLGWMWVPGSEWAPAWVCWGSYGDYYGWASLGPNVYVNANYAWSAPDPWWTFVPGRNFCSENWHNYIYDRPIRITNINRINNVYAWNDDRDGNHNSWYHGPQVSDVERNGRGRIRTMEIVESQKPENSGVRNERLTIYRPVVDARRGEGRPSAYRDMGNTRTCRQIVQTNPRANDPGENRKKENRDENRIINPLPSQRNENPERGNRMSPNTQAPASNSRNTEGLNNSNRRSDFPNPSEPRTISVQEETRVEPVSGSQVVPRGISVQPAPDTRRGTSVIERSTIGSGSGFNQPTANRAGAVNSGNRQNTPNIGNVNPVFTRESAGRQSPAVQASSEQRNQNTSNSVVSRPANTDSKQITREDPKQKQTNTTNVRSIDQPGGRAVRR
ncbi:MAG: DUF6600 domain-containing protein [Bacteroidota bacterium]